MQQPVELALVPDQVVEARALVDLIPLINEGHEQVKHSARVTLARAIQVGNLLAEARGQVIGGWEAWIRANTTLSVTVARNYLRVAYFQDQLTGTEQTVSDALQALRQLPPSGPPGRSPYPAYMKEEALALRQDGLTQEEVGERLGISHTVVGYWEKNQHVIREGARRRAKSARDRRKDREEEKRLSEHEAELVDAPKEMQQAWRMMRGALASLDRAVEGSDSWQRERLLRASRGYVTQAQNKIVEALKQAPPPAG